MKAIPVSEKKKMLFWRRNKTNIIDIISFVFLKLFSSSFTILLYVLYILYAHTVARIHLGLIAVIALFGVMQ